MTVTNIALILAAGNGSRLASVAEGAPKPLVELHGRPLIEHVISGARDAGIDRFYIVTGYRADAIRYWAQRRPFDGTRIELVRNLRYDLANGMSVLKARDRITEPFLLLMADHIFEPEAAAALLREPLASNSTILAIDRKLDRVFDIADATKVVCRGDYITAIGKQLCRYDAVDTGMFLCTPAVFTALEHAQVNGNCSLSDGMSLLAQDRKLRAFDVGDALWQDVDTPEALAHAAFAFGEKCLPDASTTEYVHV